MKQIHEMTEEEYNSLKSSGMFWEIFPEATGDYATDATQSAVNLIEAAVKQEMRDAGYTDEDLMKAEEFGEKFEALRQTDICCGQGGCGDCNVDFDRPTELQMGDRPSLITKNSLVGVGFNDESDDDSHTPTHVTVMYDATSLRLAVEWVYEHNHHIRRQHSSVDLYEKSVMSRVGRFVKEFKDNSISSSSTGGLVITGSWIDMDIMELSFLVDPSVCSKRYSHYVEMEVDGLIDFIESFAEE